MPSSASTSLAPAAPRLYVALDTADRDRAATLAANLDPETAGLKLGKEFFTAQGPAGVRAVAGQHALFLDLKFHDIPNTVAGAVRAATALGAHVINVHAAGGAAMMRAAGDAATQAAEAHGVPRPDVLAVTVLTSLDDADLAAVGQATPVAEQVGRLARLAAESDLDGVICSPRELADLRRARGPGFRLVVPGVRPAWAAAGDQKRVLTPGEAIAAGADAIVVGRPITDAPDPGAAARAVLDEIAEAAEARGGVGDEHD